MLDFVTANGLEMAYRFDGPEDAPVLVLSNSLMSTHRMWDPQMTDFSANYRVLRYDTRGHGATQTTQGPYSIDLLARDAEALIEALGIGPVHFLGLSMGGMIAQRLAVNRPDLVRSLMLCDTASEMPTVDMWNDRIAKAEQAGIEGLLGGTIQRWFTPGFVVRSPAAVGFVEGMIRDTGGPGYIGCASAVRDMSQTGILKDISQPTLVLVGDQDPACTPAQALVLHENIANSQYIVLEDAAHLANIEKPAEFNAAILNFLNGLVIPTKNDGVQK
ncbi:MAG: 3-oxoadipate enol-lactonase [Paracoccaceae bacterium]|jgi:3-oxoadipate enol-lactonase